MEVDNTCTVNGKKGKVTLTIPVVKANTEGRCGSFFGSRASQRASRAPLGGGLPPAECPGSNHPRGGTRLARGGAHMP